MTEHVLAPVLERENWVRDALIAGAFGAIPILGVLSWGWSPYALMLLFWFENAVIGFRQIAMMWLVARARLEEAGAAIAQSGFFALHYGGFALAHGFFTVLFFFVMGPHAPPPDPDGGIPVDLDIAFAEAWRLALTVPLGFAAIFGWQAVQLAQFVAREEAKTVTLKALMGEPYLRVVVLHLVLIIVGGAIMSGELSPQALVVLAIYKVAVDVGEIWWRNRKNKPPETLADLPAPKPGVVFDVVKDKPSNLFFIVGGVFFVFGLLFLMASPWFGALWLGFTGLITFFAARSTGNARRALLASFTNGTGQVAEGRVTDFVHQEREATNQYAFESFKVQDVAFAYSHNIVTGGFNRPALRGGPIREGLKVRIHFLPMAPSGNVITRIEVLP